MSACQHCGREHPPGTSNCPATGDSMRSPGLIGTNVDRYRLEGLLGAGGFGAVYRARHVHTDATVALKLLKKSLGADQQMLERFLREARAAAAVGNEHIVRVTDAGIANDGQAFLALEFLDGCDLKELATRHAPLPHQRVVALVLQVLDALSAAHAKGIVHRDMKPANVFVGAGDFVKLLDFGISKMHGDATGSGLTMTGVAMGTPSYMAPEQFFDARSVDARADLYSVAAMLYELLSGRLPFDAESYAHLIVKVRTEQPEPLHQLAADVPLPLAQVVMVGLAKEPHQRWQSAKEFSDAIRSAVETSPASPSAPLRATPLPAMAAAGFDRTHTPTGPPSPALNIGNAAPGVGAAGPAYGPDTSHGAPRVAGATYAQGSLHGVAAPNAAAASYTPGAALPPAAAPKKDNTLKWVLVVLGLLFLGGGCCTCGLIVAAADDASSSP